MPWIGPLRSRSGVVCSWRGLSCPFLGFIGRAGPAGQRVVPLTDERVDELGFHLGARPPGGLVFEGLVCANWRHRVWAPAIKAAGRLDPQPTPHDCRHSYGSWLADEGVPTQEIAALMGHSSLRAVERYIHASEGRL